MGTLYYRQLQKLVTEAGPTPISLRFSCPPEIDGQERLTEVGVFKALRGFVQCAIALTPLADKVAIITEFLSWSVDAHSKNTSSSTIPLCSQKVTRRMNRLVKMMTMKIFPKCSGRWVSEFQDVL